LLKLRIDYRIEFSIRATQNSAHYGQSMTLKRIIIVIKSLEDRRINEEFYLIGVINILIIILYSSIEFL